MDDREVFESESNSTVERIGALDRLLASGAGGLESTLSAWLRHQNAMLRGNALRALIGRLHLDAYVPQALEWLQGGYEAELRADAAYALGRYVEDTGRERDRILRAIAAVLVTTEEAWVRFTCYQAILNALGETFALVPNDFDLARDVDWRIIGPLLETKT